MCPLPGTTVIHPGWQAAHAPAAAGAMTATCALYDPAAPVVEVTDWATGQTTVTAAAPVWAGPCRVQSLAGARANGPLDAVGQEVTTPAYLVALPVDASVPDYGWPVKVTACPDDPALVGARLVVRQVVHGTQRFQRDLFCDLDHGRP